MSYWCISVFASSLGWMPSRKPQETEDMKPLFPLATVGGLGENWAWSYCMELNHDSFIDGPCPVCSRINKQDFAKEYSYAIT